MIDYLLNWLNAYVMHFGVWIAMLVSFDIYKKGLPELRHILSMFKSAIILATIVSVFSSHSHMHIVKHFLLK